MTDNSWNPAQPSKTSDQQPTTARLGIGRGKARLDTNNDEPPMAISTWNGGGNSSTSDGFKSFGNNNNDENNNSSNNNGSFYSQGGARGGRGGFGGGNSRGSGPRNDGSPRACYNCNQTGHISRDCPAPRNSNRGGGRGSYNSGGNRGGFASGGGFNSDSGDRNVSFNSRANGNNPSMSITVPNSRNQDDNGERTANHSNWQGNGANGNNTENSNGRSTFYNSASRGGGFRSGGGGFGSGDRDNRNGGDGNSFQNNNRFNNQSRDFHGERNGGDGNSFSSGARRGNDQTSDHDTDQPGGRPGGQTVDRYAPPPPPTTEDGIFGEAVTRGENFGKYHRTHVECTPADKFRPIQLYEEANLGIQILSNIRRAHFEEPTPIQRYTIPCIKQEHDIMACAQTGSGKTAAFLLPIISNLIERYTPELSERNHPPSPLCLVLSPTRELALQTEREARKFAYQTSIVPSSAIGGHDMSVVSDRLREGCHILSATTGRLKDMVEKGRISLKKVKYLVLDEADRMLDDGFEPDIRALENLGIPSKENRCTSMFSATLPNEVQNLAKRFLRDDYVYLAVGTPGGANEDIAQTIEEVPQANKKERLLELLEKNLKSERCLIFVETKRSADYLGTLLSQKNLMSTTMHGDRSQRQRSEAVQQFTNGKCPILVATSVAARGLDFPLIGYVVNYDLPDSSDFYIHRIGRTGRAGHLGKSISFFDPSRESDQKIAPDLVAKLVEAGQDVPEFLRKHTDGANAGFGQGSGGFRSRNTDMRSGNTRFNTQHQQMAGPSGGSASAGGAVNLEQWDQ